MAKENIYLCTLTWVAFNCTLRGVAIWSLNKKCHPLLTRWRWNREPKMWSIQMHIIPAAGFFQWCLHIKTEFRPKKVTKQLPKVLNIACPPPSSNRPISRASDWPIFSCLGSTTSRWKTLDTAQSSSYNPLIRLHSTHTLEPSKAHEQHMLTYSPQYTWTIIRQHKTHTCEKSHT